MRWLVPPVLWALMILAMAAQRFWLPTVPLLPDWLALIGVLPVAGGLLLSVAGAFHFRRRGTNIRPFRDPEMLVTDFVFAYSRNPMYLGFALALLGLAILFNDAGALLFVALFVIIVARWYLRLEEAAAARRCGDAVHAYRRRVRRGL